MKKKIKNKIRLVLKRKKISNREIDKFKQNTAKYLADLQNKSKIDLDMKLSDFILARR